MPDMENVIKGLEDVREYIRTSKDTGQRKARMMDKVTNAIELLKEQEAIIEQYRRADVFLAVHGWKWEGR